MRLIDLDKVDVEQIPCGYSDHTTLEDVKEWLDEMPTISPDSLVKRGQWTFERNPYSGEWNYRCSMCDGRNGDDTDYCPHCGADLRRRSNE